MPVKDPSACQKDPSACLELFLGTNRIHTYVHTHTHTHTTHLHPHTYTHTHTHTHTPPPPQRPTHFFGKGPVICLQLLLGTTHGPFLDPFVSTQLFVLRIKALCK